MTIVKHIRLGEGRFLAIKNKSIFIDFNGEERRFLFPNAFDDGVLSTEDKLLNEKISIALEDYKKQFHAMQKKPTAVIEEISKFKPSFISDRMSSNIIFDTDDDLFEAIGYLAKPGVILQIEAQVPADGNKDEEFRFYFPEQTYRPISMKETASGIPTKFGPQYRIYLGSIENCPNSIKNNLGKGQGKSVKARINRSRFVILLVHFFGFKFGYEQDLNLIRKKVIQYGYLTAFNKGFNR